MNRLTLLMLGRLKNTLRVLGLLGVMLVAGSGVPLEENSGESREEIVTSFDGSSLTFVKEKSFNPTIEVPCEDEDALPPPWTCFDIVSKFSDITPDPDRCAPRDVVWTMGFGFPSEDLTGTTYLIRIFWDVDNNPLDQSNLTPTWNAGSNRYEVTANKTYPQNGQTCTYTLRARLLINGANCSNADGNIFEELVVWDDLSNANLGNHDIDHDNTSAGVEVGETVEVCRTDTSPVRLVDTSTFNCQAPIEDEPANENRRDRWVQWVYGSAGTTVTDDVIVNGVTYTSAQFPIYGTPTQQPFPPDVLGPNAITDDIQMPATATVGEVFEVTIRSWNICNKYSSNEDLNPPQGGGNNVFQINGSGSVGTEQPGLNAVTGGVNFYSNDNPITRTFDIVIAPQPPDPVAVNTDYCRGTNLSSASNPGFVMTAAGNVATEWYEDNTGVIDFGSPITNSNGPNELELMAADYEGVGGPGLTGTDVGTYYVWGRYSSNTGSQNCWSNPVRMQLDIREQLTTPASVSSTQGGSGFTICADGPLITFTVDDGPPGTGTPGGAWEYDWAFGGGSLNDNLTFTTPDGLQSRTVDITSNAASGARRVRVRRRYVTTDDNGSRCQSGYRNFDFTIDPVSIGGSLTGTNTICLGENTGNIQLTGQTGNIQGWEVNINGGGFNLDGSLGTANPINPIPGVVGTHEYRAIVKSGVCAQTTSSTVTITVNPSPPKPTISEVGDGLTICQDGSSTILQSSDVGGVADEYHWFKLPDTTTPVQAGGSNQLTLTTVAQSGDYVVKVVGIDPTDCESPLSDPATVTINPLPTATVSGGGSVCAGNPAPDITWTFTGTAPYDFTITLTPGTNIVETGWPSNTYTIVGPSPGVNTDYEMTALQDANSCDAVSMGGPVSVTIQATPPPTVESFTATAAVCDDGVGTDPPNAILDLLPNSIQTYDITYEVNGNVFVLNAEPSDINGIITLTPPYSAWGSTPGSYVVTVTALKNTVTLCAGAVPFDSDPLVVDPRPAAPTNPIDNIACSDGGGTMLSVDPPPGATEVVRWYLADGTTPVTVPADGVISGAKDSQFTPTASTTATFFTRIEETTTTCESATSVQLDLTEDTDPPDATIATADFNTCNSSETITANAVVGGYGEWVFSSGLFWREPFDNVRLGAKDDTGTTQWTIDETINPNGGTHEVVSDVTGHRFMVNNSGGSSTPNPPTSGISWISGTINVAAATNDVLVTVDVEATGVAAGDWIEGWYTLDGSIPVPYTSTNWFANTQGAIAPTTYSVTIPNGSLGAGQLRLLVRVRNGSAGERHYIDNITVREDLGGVPGITPNRYSETVTVNNLLESELVPGANEFTWNAYSNLGVCQPAPASMTITRWQTPDANDTTPDICEDTYTSDQATIADLTVYDDDVTGIVGSTDRTITYYSDPARTMVVTNITVTGASPVVYTRVARTDVTPNCTTDGTLTFNILTLPQAVDQNAGNNVNADLCEETVGSGDKDNVDLTVFDNDVIAGQANRTVVWYLDPGGPVTGPGDLIATVPTPTDVDNITDGTLFYALITETSSGSGCQNVAQVEFTIKPRPLDNPIQAPDLSTPATVTLCKSSANQLFQVDDALNTGSAYNWTVPQGPGQFVVVGPTNLQFVVIQAPNAIPGGLPITLQETLPNGCVGNVNTITVIVEDAPPAPVITGPSNVCDGQNGVVYSIAAPIAGNTYNWDINGLGTIVLGQGTDEITVNIGSTSDVITVVENSPAGCSSPPAAPYNVTVNPLPNMTSPNAAALCSGETVSTVLTFTDDIGGGGTYGWEVVAKSGSVGGTAIGNTGSGDINQTLTNTSGSTGDVTYEVTPTSAAPANCDGPTQIVVITVYSDAVGADATIPICSDAANNYDIQVANIDFLGNNVNSLFTYTVASTDEGNVPSAGLDRVAASADPITDTYTNTTGVTVDMVYTITPIEQVSGTNCTGATFDVTFRIASEPLGISSTEANVCSDVAFDFDPQDNVDAVGGNGMTSSFAWTAVYNGMTGGAGAGVGNVAETLTNTSGGTVNAVYTVTPVSGGCAGDPFTITVPVDSEPVGVASTEATVCSDQNFVFDPQDNIDGAGGNSVASTFTWTAAYNGMTGGAGAGAGVISETLNNVTGSTQNAVYTISPTSIAGSCVGDDYTITVPVYSDPLGVNSTETTVCSDQNFVFDPQNNIDAVGGNSVPSTFAWTATYSGMTGGAGAGTGVINETLNNVTGSTQNAVYTITPTSILGICDGATFTITVPVYSDPEGINTTEAAVCSQEAFTFDPQNNIDAVGGNNVTSTFSWVAVYGVLTGGAGAGVGSISETLTNTSGATVNAVYTVTPTSTLGACEGAAFTITVPVDSEPLGINTTESTVCSDQNFTFDPQDNIDAVGGNSVVSTFTWTATYGSLTGGAGAGTGTISETLNNVSGAVDNAVYTVTPTSVVGTCTGAPFTITVPVYSDPLGVSSTETIVCSDQAFSIDPQDNIDGPGGNSVASTFTWTAIYNGMTGGAGAGTGVISETLNNVTGATQNAVYTVTPTSVVGTCQGDDFTITVPVYSEPLGINTTETTVCSDQAFTFDPQDNIDAVGGNAVTSNFTWTAAYGALTGGAGAGAGVISETLNNVSGGTVNAVYTVTPVSALGACTGATFTITVPVYSDPLGANSTEANVCSDVGFLFDPQDNINGGGGNSVPATFAWTASYGALTGGAGAGTGVISETLNNVTSATINAVYTVTPTSVTGSCVGDPFTITVPIDPEPLGVSSTEIAVCSDVPFVFDPQDNVDAGGGNSLNSTFTWTAAYGATTGGAGAGAGTISETLNNVSGATVNVVYTVTPTSVTGTCLGDPFTITVPIFSDPLGINTTETTVCSDQMFTIDPQDNVDAVGGNMVASNFTWTAVYGALTGGAGAGAGVITETLNNVSGSTLNAVYTVTPVSALGACTGNTFTITVPVYSDPLGINSTETNVCSDVPFTFDPQDNVNAVGGNNVASTFTWTANYGLLTGGVGAGTGTISETLNNVTGSTIDAVYTVIPTSVTGTCTGDPFTITVPIDPEPLGSNSTEAAVCSDIAFSFDPQNNISNLPPGSTFAWTAVYGGSLSGGAGAGTGTIAETLNNVSGGTLNAVYTVTPTSAGGLCVGNDFTITVPINSEPLGADDTKAAVCSDVAFSFDPQNEITNGQTATFAWTATYAGTLTGGAGSGTGTISETLTNTSGGQLDAVYTITPTAVGCVGNSFTITVPIDPEPLGANSAEAAVCSDVAFSFDPQDNISNLPPGSTFSWTATYAGALSGGAGSGTGVINETLTNTTSGQLDAVYTVTPTSAGGSCVGNTYTITVPIDPEPLGANSTEAAVCSDVAFNIDPQNNISNLPPGSTFAWTAVYGGSLSGGAGAGTGNIAETLTNVSGGQLNAVYTVTPTTAGTLCVGDAFTITVPINSEPLGTPVTQAAVCSDVAFSFDPQAQITNGQISTFTWTATYPAQLTGGAGAGTGFVAETLTNVSAVQLNATYTIIPTSGGCVGNAYVMTVPVDPEPLGANSTEAAVCSDVAFNFDPQNNISNLPPGSTFTWTAVYNGSLAGGAGAGAGNIAETLTNTSATQLDAVYTITPTSSGSLCVGNTFTITVPIDPEPAGTNTTEVAVCSDIPFSFDPQNNITNLPPGSTFAWTASYPGGLTGGAGAGAGLINETLTNRSGGQLSAVYTIVPTAVGTSCVGDAFTITVPIDSEPAGYDDLANPANELCSGDFINYNIQTLNIDDIGNGGNALPSTFTYTVSSSDEANVPSAGMDRVVPSTSPITDSYTNDTGSDVIITYTITPFGFVTSCQGDPFDVEFTIYSEPRGFNDAVIQCSDTPLNYDINAMNISIGGGNNVPSDFTFVVSSDNPLVNPEPNRTTKSDAPITFTYTNTSAVDANITYTITPISKANNCAGVPFDVVFTIQVEPAGANYSETQCGGTTLNHDLNTDITNGIDSKFYYTVASNNPGVPAGPDRPFASASDAPITDTYNNTTAVNAVITYTVTPIDKATNCEGDAFTVVFTIEPGPEGVADTEEECSGIALNYDIQSDNINNGGNNVPGKFTYTVSSANQADVPAEADRTVASTLPITHTYVNTTTNSVDVTYTITPEGFGAGCVGSPFDVVFTIHPEPVIVANAATICSRDAIPITMTLTNFAPTAVDWYYEVTNISGVVTGVNLGDNGITNTLPHIITNTSSANAIITYSFTATSQSENCVGSTEEVLVTVQPEPVMSPSLSNTTCSGENSGIELATNGTSAAAANYRLITAIPAGGLIPDPSNATNGSLGDKNLIIADKFTNTTNGALDVTYTVEAISANNCTGSPPVSFTLTVNPEPVLSPTLDPTPVCSDVASGVILDVDVGSVAADRYHIVGITFDPGLIPAGGNAAIGNDQAANVLANDTYTNTTSATLFATYDVIPVSVDNCEGEIDQVRFTVNPAPALSPALDEIACSDEGSGIVLDDDGVSIPATSFDIINVTFPGLTPDVGNATTGVTADVNALANDRYTNPTNGVLTATYEVVPISAASCRGPSGFITLTVEPTLNVAANNANPNICSGGQTFIELSSTSVPSAGSMSFNVTASANGNVTGFIPSLNNLPPGYQITDFLTNNESVVRTVTYTITPRAEGGSGGSGCSGTPIVETVDVDPNPDVVPTNNAPVICSGDNTDIDLSSSVAGSTFTWTAAVSDPTVTGAAPGNGNNISQTIVNSGSSMQFVTYTITPTGPGALACVGNTFDVQVQVNPLPNAAISGATSICAGSFATLQIDMQGQLPFTVVYNDGTSDITVPNVGNTHFLTVQPTQTTTYSLVSVSDGNGCQQPSLGGSVTVEVEDAVSDFTIESSTSGCSPLEVTFRNNAVTPGVTYEWSWGDGSSSTITSDEVVVHEFANQSTTSTLSYNVTLIATNDLLGCRDITTETVEVFPSILLNIIPSTDKGCGPVAVSFVNSSLGVSTHKWFYREKGTTQETEVVSTPFVTYELPNKTTSPITYEVVYIGSNGNCEETVINEVLVLPELEPSFTIGDNPVEVTASPHVTITNTTPNKDAWTYLWEWGDGTTTTAVDPGSHTYTNEEGEPTYGTFEIVQRITYEDINGKCEAATSVIFTVEPVFPEVDFEADVLEGCRPIVVNFTNLSVAVDPETVFWEFIAPTGAVEGTSQDYNPTFTFHNAGKYTIRLTAGNAIGVTETETKEFYITVNDLPITSFTVRPDKVFLPDGIVYTQNLSSNGADTYFWIFNYQDYIDPTADGTLDESDLVSTLYEPEVIYKRRGWKDVMLISTISETGCSDTLFIPEAVFVDEGGNARVPNAFTPNKNGPGQGGSGSGGAGGFNEVFLPVIQGLSSEPGSFHMLVYDRWGNLIFESWDEDVGWDGYDENGKLLPLGVYVYKLDLRFNDGTSGVRIGDVTLIR